MKSRKILWAVVALLLVLMGAVVLAGGRNKKPAAKPEPMVTVLKAAIDIQPGTYLDDRCVVEAQVPESEKGNKYKDAVADKYKILGGTATQLIRANEGFLPTAFKPPVECISRKITPGYVAVTIPAPEKPSLYDLDFLNYDDRIDIMGITYDEQGNWTTSTPLATNVRIMAIDKRWDKYREAQRMSEIDVKIKSIQDEKARRQQPPSILSADQAKNYDDQVKALQDSKNPGIENPSITVEVTNAQAQILTLWRQSPRCTLKLALHRQPDSAQLIFADEQLAAPLPGNTATGATPTVANLNPATSTATPTVLTMDDVVPLLRRDPKQYAELLSTQKQITQTRNEQALAGLDQQVKTEELRQQLKNLRDHGDKNPVVRPATTPAATVPPVLVPRTAAPTPAPAPAAPAATSGAPERQAAPTGRYHAPIEVYRGSAMTTYGG